MKFLTKEQSFNKPEGDFKAALLTPIFNDVTLLKAISM